VEEPDPRSLFQGSELPRLLVLLVIAVGGWVAVWYYLMRPREEGPVEPEQVVTGNPEPVEPDRSIEFETVSDKTSLSFRDMAAYDLLLTRAREATPADLAGRSRRDVFYAHLWDQPKGYRGVPVHLLGTARRVLYYKSKLSRTGWLYEAWVFTPDGQNNPYVCVFEEAPKGFPVGPNVSERVVFNGYFLKLMRYEAGDVPRAAPLLVGRIGWTPRPDASGSPDRSAYWLAGAVAVMFLISLARWIVQLRRSLAPKPRPSILLDRPTDEIAPADLAEFLENLSPDDEPPSMTQHGRHSPPP
jgi:hypothetical protein